MNASQRCAMLVFTSLVLTATAAADETNVTAPNADRRYVAFSAQHDEQSNQQLLATGSVTLGDHAWLLAGGGQSRSTQAASVHRPVLLTAGAGAVGGAWQFGVNVMDRHDGHTYRQRDWSGTLDWHNELLNLGVDGAHRDAHLDSTVAQATSQGGTAYVPITQRVNGAGFGLHFGINATDRLTVFTAGMKYHYTVSTQQEGVVTVSGNTGGSNLNTVVSNLLANKPLLDQATLTRTSVVTRDEAVLDRSLSLGASYRFERVGLTGEYFNDRVVDTSGAVTTLQAKAAFNVAPGWLVTPGVGHSYSKQYGGVNYGLLVVNYAW